MLHEAARALLSSDDRAAAHLQTHLVHSIGHHQLATVRAPASSTCVHCELGATTELLHIVLAE